MKKALLIIPLMLAMLSFACTFNIGSNQIVEGSGVTASETRSVKEFTSIELSGSADVSVSFGESQSVLVEADDNILPLIETTVRAGKLVIRTKDNTNIVTDTPVQVTIVMKSLEAVSLPGSGNITIAGLQADKMDFDMDGSGNINAGGTADRVEITLGGSGNILCKELEAQTATVKLNGSGNITVYASQSLDVKLSGSGSVYYSGNPSEVNQSVPGSGVVEAAP